MQLDNWRCTYLASWAAKAPRRDICPETLYAEKRYPRLGVPRHVITAGLEQIRLNQDTLSEYSITCLAVGYLRTFLRTSRPFGVLRACMSTIVICTARGLLLRLTPLPTSPYTARRRLGTACRLNWHRGSECALWRRTADWIHADVKH